MGLLDDAIREHLDLKRRRGADPSEVERLEREALGPVRRSPHEARDVMVEEEPPAGAYPVEAEMPDWEDSLEEPAPFDHAADTDLDAPTQHWSAPAGEEDFEERTVADFDLESAPAPEREYDLPKHHEIAEEWEAHERQGRAGDPGLIEPDSPAPSPPPPAADSPNPAPASRPMSEFDQETVEYEVEVEEPELEERDPDAAGAGENQEGEELLEETPDFLQDTPDHDRLWFEQRPPRDFDFDK